MFPDKLSSYMPSETANLTFKPRDFVHLHLHTDYSLLQSAIQLKPLARRLDELKMLGCAITDYGNMYGAVSFYNTLRSSGLRPILGYEAFVACGSRLDRSANVPSGELPFYHLVLLAEDLEGYQNLVFLASAAFTEGLHHKPRIDLDLLADHSRGLIGLSAGPRGSVSHFLQIENEERACREAGRLSEIFGKSRFYIEIQNHGDEDRDLINRLAALAKKCDLPLVASNDCHYLTREDSLAHEILDCIADGRTLDRNDLRALPNDEYYVKSSEEMWRIFGSDFPEALQNTCRIAEMCDVEIPMGDDNLQLPDFTIPIDAGCSSTNEYFRKVLSEGFETREKEVWLPMAATGKLKYSIDDYQERLNDEIAIIERMKYEGYFLVVWDFVKYAREKGIPVGPGRGSAAGSLAAYCLRITDIDPLQYDLLFERFLNPERVSMPDIDIDFCIRGRGDVINHVTDLYGRESVCQIITFGTMASRAAIKDVGRALSMPFGDVERIAKLIPPPWRGRNVSISEALERVTELKEYINKDPQVKELIDIALRLEGCSRHTSVHAAGVVISPKPLHELVPVAVSPKNELTSQYTMLDLEKVGMLKMDFLGLTTLTIIDDCVKSIFDKTGTKIDWTKVSLEDEETMKVFCDGRTEAVFQFESSGIAEITRRLKPKKLEDLSALNALYRPGPLDGGMVEDYIQRHRGEKPVRFLIPQMKDILAPTFGVLVYQEQIMQLAQKLAGYSLGEADLMRRAMGKKKREEMAVHEQKFINGAVANGIDRKKATEIFNLMSQFADYGFNRSHSIAYAYLAFQTAYLKAHFPAHFYAAVLSHEAQDSAKVYKYSNEFKSVGLKLLPPDINESDLGFTPHEEGVRYGLTAIKGIGTSCVSSILNARKDGKFTSPFDFVSRVEPSALNRRSLESLIAAGAFDSLMPERTQTAEWRARLFNGVSLILQSGQRSWEDRTRGQSALFGAAATGGTKDIAGLPECASWSQAELSKHEKAAVGFYLSVHPLDDHQTTLSKLGIVNLADHEQFQPGQTLVLAGLVSNLQVRYSKKGNRFGMFRLEDQSGGIKCIAWGETFTRFSSLLRDDELIIAEGRIEASEGQDETLIVSEIKLLADAEPTRAREAAIRMPQDVFDEEFYEQVFRLLNNHKGKCGVTLRVPAGVVEAELEAAHICVKGSAKLDQELRGLGCSVDWIV
jgi:DNA polymerase-3 subunit alpha